MQGADKGYTNEAAILYWEYLTRRNLAKLGYRSSLDDLDCLTADAFAIIEEEVQNKQNKELEKAKRKSAPKGRR